MEKESNSKLLETFEAERHVKHRDKINWALKN